MGLLLLVEHQGPPGVSSMLVEIKIKIQKAKLVVATKVYLVKL